MDNYECINLNKWNAPQPLKDDNFSKIISIINDDNILTSNIDNTLYYNGQIQQLSPLDTEILKINAQKGGMMGGVDDEVKLNEDELVVTEVLEDNIKNNSLLLLPLNPLKIIYTYFKKYLPSIYWKDYYTFKSNSDYINDFENAISFFIDEKKFIIPSNINQQEQDKIKPALIELIKYYNDNDLDIIIDDYIEVDDTSPKCKVKIDENGEMYVIYQKIDNTGIEQKKEDAQESAIIEYINDDEDDGPSKNPNIDVDDIFLQFKIYQSISGEGAVKRRTDFLATPNDLSFAYLRIKDKIKSLKKVWNDSTKKITGIEYLKRANLKFEEDELTKIICDPVEVITTMMRQRSVKTTKKDKNQTLIRYYTDFYDKFPYCCNNGCFRLVGTEIFIGRNVFKNFRQACKKCDDARVANNATNHIYDHGFRVHIFDKKLFFIKTMPTILKRDYCENAIPERRIISIRNSFQENPAEPPTEAEKEAINEFNKKLQIRKRIGTKSREEYPELRGVKQQCPLNLIGDKWDEKSIKKEFGVINYEKKKYLIGLSKIYNYLVSNCYDQDHISGEHTSNVFSNLWTLCKICHSQKTLLGGDFGVKKDSDKFESGSTKIVNDVFVEDKNNNFSKWNIEIQDWDRIHNDIMAPFNLYLDEIEKARLDEIKKENDAFDEISKLIDTADKNKIQDYFIEIKNLTLKKPIKKTKVIFDVQKNTLLTHYRNIDDKQEKEAFKSRLKKMQPAPPSSKKSKPTATKKQIKNN